MKHCSRGPVWVPVSSGAPLMHEIAKLLLEHARTEEERSNAIEKAMYLGMPLHEIEAYLDWLDMMPERMNPEKPPD